MYKIIKQLNGKFLCQVRVQDGTESWTEDNLAQAKKSVKESALALNNAKIKYKDIDIYHEKKVNRTEKILVKD